MAPWMVAAMRISLRVYSLSSAWGGSDWSPGVTRRQTCLKMMPVRRPPTIELVRPIAPWRVSHVAAKGALIAVFPAFEAVPVVGEKLLRHLDIDLPLILRHQFLPALVTGIGRAAHVAGIEIGLFLDEVGVAGKV